MCLKNIFREDYITVLFACLIAFLSPVRLWIPEISVIWFIIWFIFRIIKKDFHFFVGEKREIFVLGAIFFAWVIFTSFFREGIIMKEISNGYKYIGILIFPLLFWYSDVFKQRSKKEIVANFTIISLLVICVFSVIKSFLSGQWYYVAFQSHFPRSWFSTLIGLGLILSVYFVIEKKNKLRYFYISSTFFFLWSIFLLSFRRNFVALFAVLVFGSFFYLLWSRSFKKGLFIFGIVFLIFFSTFYSNGRIKNLSNSKRTFKDIRTQMWKVAWRMTKKDTKSLLIGYGKENVEDAYQKAMQKDEILSKNYLSTVKNSCHNDWLDIITQYGMIGFFLFLFFCISVFVNGIRQKNIYLLVFLIFYFVEFMFGSYFFIFASGKFIFFFWLYFFDQFYVDKSSKYDLKKVVSEKG